jgi:hypothetical protein
VVGEAVEFEGRKVYLNDNLDLGHPQTIDTKYVHPKIQERLAAGQTNLDLMKQGKAPIGSDGRPINLHHVIGEEPGPMIEIESSLHEKFTGPLHAIIEDGRSFRQNAASERAYEAFRARYWKWRASRVAP